MSFMAGFGQGFSDMYTRKRSQQAAEARTTADRMWQTFNDAYSNEAKRTKEKNAIFEQAERLAEIANLGGDPRAVNTLAKELKFKSFADLEKDIRSGEFKGIRGISPQDAKEAQETSLGEESEDVFSVPQEGAKTVEERQVDPEMQQGPEDTSFGGMLSKLGRMYKNRKSAVANRRTEEVYQDTLRQFAESKGISVEDAEETIRGAFDPESAPYEGAGTGEVLYAQASEGESKYALDKDKAVAENRRIQETYNKEVEPVASGIRTFKSLVRNAGTLRDVATGDERVVNERLSGLSQAVSGVKATIEGIVGWFTSEEATPDSTELRLLEVIRSNEKSEQSRKAAEALYQREASILQEIEKTADASRIFEQRVKVLAYQMGMLYEQTGRAFSEGERVMFMEIARSGNNLSQFQAGMQSLLTEEYRQLQDKVDGANRIFENERAVYENSIRPTLGYLPSLPEPLDLQGSLDDSEKAILESFGNTPTPNSEEKGDGANRLPQNIKTEMINGVPHVVNPDDPNLVMPVDEYLRMQGNQ